MRKLRVKGVVLCLAGIGSVLFSALPTAASHLSLKLYGGGSWIGGGDLNRHIQGWKSLFSDLNVPPYSFDLSLNQLHALWESGVEVTYRFTPRISISLGLGYTSGKTQGEARSSLKKQESYFYSAEDFGTFSVDEQSQQLPEYRLQTYPLTGTLCVDFPSGGRLHFFLGAGGGYYSGKITYMENYQYDSDIVDEKIFSGSLLRIDDTYSSSGTYTEALKSSALGLHAGGGLEYRMSQRFSLVVEMQGRWVEFRNWHGQKTDKYTWDHVWGAWGTNSDSGSAQQSEDGKLWMVNFQSDATGKSYPHLAFSANSPLSSFYSGARLAHINLNGLILRLGVRINF